MFSFLHQKTYIVGKKENIYGIKKATVILLHIYTELSEIKRNIALFTVASQNTTLNSEKHHNSNLRRSSCGSVSTTNNAINAL